MSYHLIHTQVLEANFQDKSAAIKGQQILKELFYEAMLPTMEKVMEDYQNVQQSIQIEKLDLDLGRIPSDLPPELIKQRLHDAFETALKKAFIEEILIPNPTLLTTTNKSNPDSNSDQKTEWELLRHFLEFGNLPWWVTAEKKKSFTSLISSQLFKNPEIIFSWLKVNPISFVQAKRLVNLLPQKSRRKLIEKVGNKIPKSAFFRELSEMIYILIHRDSISVREVLFYLETLHIYAAFGKENKLSTKLKKVFQAFSNLSDLNDSHQANNVLELAFIILNFNNLNEINFSEENFNMNVFSTKNFPKKELSKNPHWKKIFEELELEAIQNYDLSTLKKEIFAAKDSEKKYLLKHTSELNETEVIHNAGLVLTAAFLPRFFQNIGLTDSGKFINKSAQSKAALVLQSMVSGEDKIEEFDLILNKILCGIHPADSIEMVLPLEQKITDEIPLLLESMASQWTALKSKSGKMISEGFLKRVGVLRRVQRGYQLQIERQAFDILLDRLPWSISIIKLPWMEDIIAVEW